MSIHKTRAIDMGSAGGFGPGVMKKNPHLAGILPGTMRLPDSHPEQVANKRIRTRSGSALNKTEARALRYLQALNPGVNIRAQAKRYQIANGVTYTPDLTGYVQGRETCWEVKGPQKIMDDATVKLKCSARAWPEVAWILMWEVNGAWQFQTIEEDPCG